VNARLAAAAAAATAAAAGAGLAGYAIGVEPRRLVVTRYAPELPGWPAPLSGLRAGVMSDLHSGVPFAGVAAIDRWVARMNAEAPDLVLLGGDYVDAHFFFGRKLAPERVAERLAELSPPLGTYAVLGNHDWRAFGARTWSALDRAGIRVLENAAASVQAPGGRFTVAGVADLRTRRPDLRRALAGVPPEDPVLLLSHDPDVFPFLPARVSLTVSGHTHGGQVAVPYLRRPVIPSAYGERFARGHIVERGRHLVVSSGLGTSGAPIRLLAPPEIVLLELLSPSRARPRA
jgi:predicted MPP superfamily phosphohydrolase